MRAFVRYSKWKMVTMLWYSHSVASSDRCSPHCFLVCAVPTNHSCAIRDFGMAFPIMRTNLPPLVLFRCHPHRDRTTDTAVHDVHTVLERLGQVQHLILREEYLFILTMATPEHVLADRAPLELDLRQHIDGGATVMRTDSHIGKVFKTAFGSSVEVRFPGRVDLVVDDVLQQQVELLTHHKREALDQRREAVDLAIELKARLASVMSELDSVRGELHLAKERAQVVEQNNLDMIIVARKETNHAKEELEEEKQVLAAQTASSKQVIDELRRQLVDEKKKTSIVDSP
jgi:hypothetical protein